MNWFTSTNEKGGQLDSLANRSELGMEREDAAGIAFSSVNSWKIGSFGAMPASGSAFARSGMPTDG